MPSQIPLRTPVWRLSSGDLQVVLEEAVDQLKPRRDAYLESQLKSYQENLEHARERRPNDTKLEEAQLASAERRLADGFEPSWYLLGKKDRVDRPVGSIEEIAPTIAIPSRHTYASVRMQAGPESITVVLGSSKAEIELNGVDAKWLKHAELWAQHTLKLYRPRWWWMSSFWGYLAGAAAAILVGFAPTLLRTSFPILATPGGATVTTIISLSTTAAFVIAVVRRGAIITKPGASRSRAFLKQTGLLLAGGIIGQAFSVAWQFLTGAS